MADAPPSYDTVVGSGTTSKPRPSHLEVPSATNGIPPANRRSMEDEHRPLPAGWVRQFDEREHHQFFVDTRADPPRSIWHHPYDDDTYLSTLTAEERERIQQEESELKIHHGSSDDESGPSRTPAAAPTSQKYPAELPPRPAGGSDGKKTFGRKLKDKVTGSTHEERVRERAQREKEEREYYEAHMKFRTALARAQQTGQPQFFAKDRDGKDIYIEPPAGPGAYGGYGGGGYGLNPYSQGPYANPNVRFIRPQASYQRPYGYGYGGGYGLPLAGGLLGGALLGGLLF